MVSGVPAQVNPEGAQTSRKRHRGGGGSFHAAAGSRRSSHNNLANHGGRWAVFLQVDAEGGDRRRIAFEVPRGGAAHVREHDEVVRGGLRVN